MYHEYVSPDGRLHRRHYNGISHRRQEQDQSDQYTNPDSDFWESQAMKSCDLFHDLAGMTAPVYETFIEYLEADNFHGKSWKEINASFRAAIHAFQTCPEASAETLAWCAGILPDDLCICNGVSQAVEIGLKP